MVESFMASLRAFSGLQNLDFYNRPAVQQWNIPRAKIWPPIRMAMLTQERSCGILAFQWLANQQLIEAAPFLNLKPTFVQHVPTFVHMCQAELCHR